MEILRPDNSNSDPEKIFIEIKNRINDDEVMNEIEKKFDFSIENKFIKNFKENFYNNSMEPSSIFNDSSFDKRVSDMDNGEIYTIASETIVLGFGRPSLLIQNDRFEAPQSEVWRNRLNNRNILTNIPSVGKIKLKNHPVYDWVGTGWILCDSDLIITNRHVANEFAKMNNGSYDFRKNYEGKKIQPSIDFKEEYQIDNEIIFRIDEIVHIAKDDEPDVAILKINTKSIDNIKPPIGLKISKRTSEVDSFVYTLGYPARDSRIKDTSLMESIFKGVYDVKRLAPGKIIDTDSYPNEYHHDCSTLGGNSGSPVLDLNSGEVVGLHHAGQYRKYNWAVQCIYLNTILNQIN
jgi:endonuclease G